MTDPATKLQASRCGKVSLWPVSGRTQRTQGTRRLEGELGKTFRRLSGPRQGCAAAITAHAQKVTHATKTMLHSSNLSRAAVGSDLLAVAEFRRDGSNVPTRSLSNQVD